MSLKNRRQPSPAMLVNFLGVSLFHCSLTRPQVGSSYWSVRLVDSSPILSPRPFGFEKRRGVPQAAKQCIILRETMERYSDLRLPFGLIPAQRRWGLVRPSCSLIFLHFCPQLARPNWRARLAASSAHPILSPRPFGFEKGRGVPQAG